MSDREPTDALAKALFEAARRRRPSDVARAATRAAMDAAPPDAARTTPEARRVAVWAALLAAAALLVAIFATRARSARAPSISPEDVTSWRATEPKTASTSLTEPVPERELAEPARPRRKVAPVPRQTPSATPNAADPPPPLSLSDEVAALDQVRAVLAAGDHARALRLLDEYDALRGKRLTGEATLLRIEGLAHSGEAAAAAALARRFVEANPASPLAESARAFMGRENSAKGPGDSGM